MRNDEYKKHKKQPEYPFTVETIRGLFFRASHIFWFTGKSSFAGKLCGWKPAGKFCADTGTEKKEQSSKGDPCYFTDSVFGWSGHRNDRKSGTLGLPGSHFTVPDGLQQPKCKWDGRLPEAVDDQ